ncbi:hypothetical protein JVT61DRAFT_714 [Boletus reticuloceps]|uniref:Uncharacterized protein n=1 Tax=Boletus reticuloceps TaxID=495285 RepID=A0A8I2Z112_9AGAM|nr:hypothetical protein JVT61DRAFT_714 [Boletus reticuloceps]
MAKFILCQVEGRDDSFEDPLELYRNALVARPLAVVQFARFEKRRDEVEAVQAEALLREAMELCSTGSHENRDATFLLQLRGGRGVEPVDAGESPVELRSTSCLTDSDSWIICGQLLDRFERFGDSTDMEQAITHLENMIGSLKCSGS